MECFIGSIVFYSPKDYLCDCYSVYILMNTGYVKQTSNYGHDSGNLGIPL